MWTHKSKFKGKLFLGNNEWTKAGVFSFKLKNAATGKEVAKYKSHQEAKSKGWVKG